MLPKRPVSCLAVLMIPFALVLVVIVIAGYALKFFFPGTYGSRGNDSATQTITHDTQAAPSHFPSAVPSSTSVLVALSGSTAQKDQIVAVDRTGKTMSVTPPDGWVVDRWNTAGFSLLPPDDAVTSSAWQLVGRKIHVSLVTKSGAKWQDPVIWGVFADDRVAIVAHRDHRALLSVSAKGDIKVIDVLEDALTPLAVQGKYAWFVRSAQASCYFVGDSRRYPRRARTSRL